MSQAIILILLTACGETKLPAQRQNDGEEPSSEPSDEIDCVEQWSEGEDGIWYDPVNCGAWSPVSDPLSWHEAVNPSEADSGGCDSNCDEEPNINYCEQLSLGGVSNWRVPIISELEDLAIRQSPFVDILDDLWSLSSDSIDNLAWTANLDQPGMSVLLEKDSQAHVRCIAD